MIFKGCIHRTVSLNKDTELFFYQSITNVKGYLVENYFFTNFQVERQKKR